MDHLHCGVRTPFTVIREDNCRLDLSRLPLVTISCVRTRAWTSNQTDLSNSIRRRSRYQRSRGRSANAQIDVRARRVCKLVIFHMISFRVPLSVTILQVNSVVVAQKYRSHLTGFGIIRCSALVISGNGKVDLPGIWHVHPWHQRE